MINVEIGGSSKSCFDDKDQYIYTVKKDTLGKSDPYKRYKCRALPMNISSPNNPMLITSDDYYVECSENDFCEFHYIMKKMIIGSTIVIFGSILILLFAITLVKCCWREKRRRAKRKQQIIDAELATQALARSLAREAAAKTEANPIVYKNVTINVTEQNKILTNVNVNDNEQAQRGQRPILNHNDKEQDKTKNNFNEFELAELEIEPDY